MNAEKGPGGTFSTEPACQSPTFDEHDGTSEPRPSIMTRKTRIPRIAIALAVLGTVIYLIVDYYRMEDALWHTPLF
jgi:hypothetical protein